MSSDLEASRSGPPLRQKMTAGLVLVIAGALAVWFLIGIIKTIFFVAVGVAVIVAVLWALKTIFW
jgi:hypothetical protein